MKFLFWMLLIPLLSACWPSRIGFKDTGGMPEEWKYFSLQTLQNNAATCPLSYPATLSEALKDGIQNNTRLGLAPKINDAQITISGEITSYTVNPIAIQNGENAAKNRGIREPTGFLRCRTVNWHNGRFYAAAIEKISPRALSERCN